MSRGNPQKAMAALLPLTVRVECEGGSYEVRPMTLGMWAALERIHSPIVTGIEPKDTLEIIPSLYLLTHDPREVFRGNILELSMEWADRQPVGAVAAIKAAVDSQMAAVTDVIPEATQKKESDGWIAAIVHWAARYIREATYANSTGFIHNRRKRRLGLRFEPDDRARR